jgi:hypothetical protein
MLRTGMNRVNPSSKTPEAKPPMNPAKPVTIESTAMKLARLSFGALESARLNCAGPIAPQINASTTPANQIGQRLATACPRRRS